MAVLAQTSSDGVKAAVERKEVGLAKVNDEVRRVRKEVRNVIERS